MAWILGILISIDHYRRKRVLDLELHNPIAAEFETFLDEENAATVGDALGLSTPPDPGTFRFVVVLSSGRLLSVHSKPPPKFIVVSSRLVAHAPLARSTARCVERPLSAAELEELRLLARSAWRTPLRSSAGYILFGLLAAWQGPLLYRSGWWHSLPAAAFASVGILAITSVLRGVRRARHLHRDARLASVRIETVPHVDVVLERLLFADELWTVDGQPAPWRTASSVRRH